MSLHTVAGSIVASTFTEYRVAPVNRELSHQAEQQMGAVAYRLKKLGTSGRAWNETELGPVLAWVELGEVLSQLQYRNTDFRLEEERFGLAAEKRCINPEDKEPCVRLRRALSALDRLVGQYGNKAAQRVDRGILQLRQDIRRALNERFTYTGDDPHPVRLPSITRDAALGEGAALPDDVEQAAVLSTVGEVLKHHMT